MGFMIGAFASGLFSGIETGQEIQKRAHELKTLKLLDEAAEKAAQENNNMSPGHTALPQGKRYGADQPGGTAPDAGYGPSTPPVPDAGPGERDDKTPKEKKPKSQQLMGGGVDASANMEGPANYLPPAVKSRGLGFAEDAGINMDPAPPGYTPPTPPQKPSGPLAEQQIYDVVAPGLRGAGGTIGGALGNAWNWYTGQANKFVGGVEQGKMLPAAGMRPPQLIPQQNAPLQAPQPQPQPQPQLQPQTALPPAEPEKPKTMPYYPVPMF
jgi:hypothetical protein